MRQLLGLSVVALACLLSVATSPPQGATVRAEADGGRIEIVEGGAPVEIVISATASRAGVDALTTRGGNATVGLNGRLTIPGLQADDELPRRPAIVVELVRDATPEVVDTRNHELFFDSQRIFPSVSAFGDCPAEAATCEERVTIRVIPPGDLAGLDNVVLDWDARAELDYNFVDGDNGNPPGATVDVRVESGR